MRPEFASFRVDELMRQIELEFAPLAAGKGLDLTFMPCAAVVRSDRRLLRRLIQNLVSNAIKYTPSGRVLVGCRRRGDHLRIEVYDTGVGIPAVASSATSSSNSTGSIRARASRAGLGLGLSIVERIARVLGSRGRGALERRPRLALLRSTVPLSSAAPVDAAGARRAAPRPRPARRHHRALHRQRARGARRHGDAAARLGLRGDQGARSRPARWRRSPKRAAAPNGLLVDYHLDHGNGIEAIVALRRVCGDGAGDPDHRRPLAGGARSRRAPHGIQVLHKPVKPAALRALLAQWRVLRVAAAE